MVQGNLPVKRMVLYKHGVGFIERGGPCEGGLVKLSFKRDEMDDVLKSLSVFVKGKGRVTGVSYETADDISKLLAEKAIDVPDREAMVGLLRALRGYRIKLWAGGEASEGKVVGTDEQTRTNPAGNEIGRRCFVVLQQDDERIRPFDIDAISGMQVLDAEAREDLKFFLDAVTSERKKNMKAVTVFAEGDKPELAISYITQMPSWRVSYRLAYFRDKTLLQGWGIMDNRLDEDLHDVQLSLVAGKPISFIYDIYTPRPVRRPIVREEVRTVSAPVELEAGEAQLAKEEAELADERSMMMEADMEGAGGARSDAARMPARRRAMMSMAAPAMAPAPPEPQAMMDSTRVQTRSVEMGEFFRYDIENPVTVKRGQSAMVPILQGPIGCRKEHVYNAQKMPRNPVVTMRLENNTGLVLERGPMVVLDEGTYVGEAILPYTTAGSENHIAYSVDLGVAVTEKRDSESRMRAIRIKQRYLQKEHLEYLKTEYTVENKKDEKVLLVIEHPRRDYELADTPEPTEKTEGFFRWALDIKPKSQTSFSVKEVKTVWYSEGIREMGTETLRAYLNAKQIDKTAYSRIADIIELQRKIYGLQQQMNELAQESGQIASEQDRLRKNLGALGQSQQEAGMRGRYVSKLETQEKRLDEIKSRIQKLQSEIQSIDKDIEAKLSALE